MQRDGRVSFAAPDHRALESKFKVIRRAEADLLHVHPRSAGSDGIDRIGFGRIQRVGDEIVAVETPYQELVTEGTRNARKQRHPKWLHAVDLESVNVLGVVGVSERPAL